MHQWHIRPAKTTDRLAIQKLLQKTKIGTLKSSDTLKNFWVVDCKSRIIACAGIDFITKEDIVFTHLAVEKEFRHQGIGSKLIQQRLRFAKAHSAHTVSFVTMYYLFRFYKKRGFRTCPRKNLPRHVSLYPMFTSKRYKKCAVMIQNI